MVRIDRHPLGPRLYVIGRRLHHGPAMGAIAIAAAIFGRRRLAAAALLAAVHDIRDFPFTDRHNH